MSATVSQFYMASNIDAKIHRYHRKYNTAARQFNYFADNILITADLYIKRLNMWRECSKN